MATPYRTTPLPTKDMPPGIPFIVGNEAAERFSFYGMRGILTVFMMQHLVNAAGQKDTLSEADAAVWMHTFVWAVYLTPFLGALLADWVWGKYRTIVALSIVYCLGHLALALDVTRAGLAIGLGLIALGAGGIKGCVSAHVGDQFGSANAHLLPRVYQWFYFSINLGSAAAFLIVPPLLASHGPHWAFGLPGVVMLLATIVFWLGRKRYAHIPARGAEFSAEIKNPETWRILGRLVPLFLCVSMFWALFDQTSSRWVAQAGRMDLRFLGWELNPSQSQVFNPILVMLLIPFTAWVLYPLINRFWPLTPLRKIGLGFFVAIPSFLIPAWIEARIGAGEVPSIAWQLLAYFFITLAEVMISITCLEFAYTQAPKRLKSLVLGLFFLSVSLGNFFTALTNLIGAEALKGPVYYLFFSGCIAATAVVFAVLAVRYQPKTYLQDGSSAAG